MMAVFRTFSRIILILTIALNPLYSEAFDNPFLDGQAVFYGLEKVEVLSSEESERHIVLSDDGLEIMFHRSFSPGAYSVWRATRNNREEEFSAPSLFPELSPPQTGPTHAIVPTFLSSDGKLLLLWTDERPRDNGNMGAKFRDSLDSPFGSTQYSWFD